MAGVFVFSGNFYYEYGIGAHTPFYQIHKLFYNSKLKTMGLEKLKKSELNTLRQNYRKTKTNPDETNSCLIKLEELKEFINYIEFYNQRNLNPDKCDGIRIYLVRYPPKEASNRRHVEVDIPGKGKTSQISFAIVPTKQYGETFKDKNNNYIYGANNCYENDLIVCLSPGSMIGEHSGLCPTNCGGE
jgi:hypothetical protein